MEGSLTRHSGNLTLHHLLWIRVRLTAGGCLMWQTWMHVGAMLQLLHSAQQQSLMKRPYHYLADVEELPHLGMAQE